jgi:hypothetical protein
VGIREAIAWATVTGLLVFVVFLVGIVVGVGVRAVVPALVLGIVSGLGLGLLVFLVCSLGFGEGRQDEH